MPEIRDINWFRSWPGSYTFSTLAVVLSLVVGASVAAYQYSVVWTPLERTYLRSYVWSRICLLSPLHAPEPYKVLVSSLSGQPANQLDVDRGKSLRWTTEILPQDVWHKWLRLNIYGGRSLLGLLRPSAWGMVLSLLFLMPLGVWLDIRRASRRRDGVVLRGANLVSRQTYHLMNRRHDGVGWLTEGKSTFLERCAVKPGEENIVRVDRKREDHHMVIMGDTGTRKSVLMLQIARQVRARSECAVIYDPEREYVAELYDEKTDVILNPFDARCPAWNPSDELEAEGEAEAIAMGIFPDIAPGRKQDPFFIEKGRTVFRHLLEKRPSVDKLWFWIANADTEIDSLVKGTELFTSLTAKAYPQRAGILGLLARANKIYGSLKKVSDRPSRWSAKSWVREGNGFLFITSKPENRDALRPLITLLFDVLIMKLCARDRKESKPVWLLLDEVASLDTIPQLPTALTMGRKAGMKIVLGIQNKAQLELRYEKEAETLLSQPATKLILRLSHPQSAEFASKSIGDQEAEDQTESRSHGRGERTSATTGIRMRPAIMPAEIEGWDDGEGVLKVQGHGGIVCVKLKFPYVASKQIHPGFIPSEVAKPEKVEAEPVAVADREDFRSRKAGVGQMI